MCITKEGEGLPRRGPGRRPRFSAVREGHTSGGGRSPSGEGRGAKGGGRGKGGELYLPLGPSLRALSSPRSFGDELKNFHAETGAENLFDGLVLGLSFFGQNITNFLLVAVFFFEIPWAALG